MNRVLFFTLLMCIATFTVTAQDLISKIPKDAAAVITLKGKNIMDLVSANEFENSETGKVFLKQFKGKTDGKITNMQDLGLDLNRSFYYFLQVEEGVLRHNFLVPLKSKEGFSSLLSEREREKIITENNTSYIVDHDVITMWNNSTLLLVYEQDENKYDDYSYQGSIVGEERIEGIVIESAGEAGYPIMTFTETTYDFGNITDGDVVEHSFKFTNTGDEPLIITNAKGSCGCTVPSYPTEPISSGKTGEILVKFNSKGKLNNQSKTVTITTNTESGVEKLKIKGFVYEEGEEIIEETVFESTEIDEVEIEETVFESTEIEEIEIEETVFESTEIEEVEIEETVFESTEIEETIFETTEEDEIEETIFETTNFDDDYNSKAYKEKELKRIEAKKEAAEKTVLKAKAIMAGNHVNGSILKNSNYVKSVGKGKDEVIAWVNDFNTIYENLEPLNMFGASSLYMFNFERMYGGTSFVSKLNFEENNVHIKTKYTMNNEMASYSADMYNGKMNSKFFDYFNEDQTLGYFSINMNTEGLLNSYPKLMNTMFEGIREEDEVKDLASIGTRLFSLLIDEKAAAGIVRGDMLFVLTDLQEQEVTYTTYEYDDNYRSKEVIKTKTEAVPSFMFMFSSTEKELFNRLMSIGIREGVATFENGIYEVAIPDFPFATSVNILFKDDTILIGTSRDQLIAIKNNKYVGNVSSKHKKLISKNASTVYVNGKHILEEMPVEMIPGELQKEMNLLSDNIEDASFKVSKVKGNILESELRLNTPEGKGHKNSLAYFINMIDSFIEK